MKSQLLPNSKKVMLKESASLTSCLLKIAKRDARNAEANPIQTPKTIERSTLLTIKTIPGITSIAKLISYHLNDLLVMMGSRKEVKKDVVAKHTKQTEALAYLIEPKKQIQCNPTKVPMPINCKIALFGNGLQFFTKINQKKQTYTGDQYTPPNQDHGRKCDQITKNCSESKQNNSSVQLDVSLLRVVHRKYLTQKVA